MRSQTAATSDEAAIRALVARWTSALRAKDIGALMACYTPDILVYDLAPPLLLRGADAYRESWAQWFETFRGPVGLEVRDLEIRTSGDLAFGTSLNRIGGSRTNGEETDVWARATAGYRKIDGRWLVAHEHVSVPFYMDGSLKAAVDLKP